MTAIWIYERNRNIGRILASSRLLDWGGVLSPPTLGGGKREDLLQDDDDADLYARTTTIIESDPHITAREVP